MTASEYPDNETWPVWPPSAPCETWRWVSTRPGITRRPRASTTRAPGVRGARSAPTAVILPVSDEHVALRKVADLGIESHDMSAADEEIVLGHGGSHFRWAHAELICLRSL
jgi:hypothetical protein